MSEQKTFDVSGEGIHQHEVGNKDCIGGWCGGFDEFPHVHEGCGGLVHADFGDEDADDSYWLYCKCDKCGEQP